MHKMKAFLFSLITLVLINHVQAELPKSIANLGYMEPKVGFRRLLEIVANIANKQVVVDSEDVLAIQTSLVLPGPVSYENARKVIDALLMLEGYELVAKGEELHLQRVLTKEQCDALNKALGKPRLEDDHSPARQRVSGRAGEVPKQWVVVRPIKK